MQSQGVTENIDAARRDSRLLRMAFRRARQAGDYRGALAASQLGEQMGLQVGVPVRDEAIKGLGTKRFGDKMEMDRRFGGPLGSGMDSGAQDAAGQQQLGVGGYDFNQQYGSPLAPQQQQPSTLDLQRAVARRKWQMAKTTEEKDAITEESAAKGLTLNPSAVQDALMRRRNIGGSGVMRERGNFGVPNTGDMNGAGVMEPKTGTGMIDPRFGVPGLDKAGTGTVLANSSVPTLQSRHMDQRIRDMRGRGVRQNPEFSPAADKAFAEQQAAEKAASNADIQRQYEANVAPVRRIEAERKALVGQHQEGMALDSVLRTMEPKWIGQGDAGNQLGNSLSKFGDLREQGVVPNLMRQDRLKKALRERSMSGSIEDTVKSVPAAAKEAGGKLSDWFRKKTGGRITF